jgi:hypothetical protein
MIFNLQTKLRWATTKVNPKIKMKTSTLCIFEYLLLCGKEIDLLWTAKNLDRIIIASLLKLRLKILKELLIFYFVLCIKPNNWFDFPCNLYKEKEKKN